MKLHDGCGRSSPAHFVDVSSAGRLLPAGALPAVPESAHPAEESRAQHSGQHPLKGRGSIKTPTASPATLSETLIRTSSVSPQARGEGYGSVLTGSVVGTLLDAGLIFLLRFALDDSVEGVMSQAVHALKALLVCAEDEVRQTAGTRAAPHTIHIFLFTAFVNGLLLLYLKNNNFFLNTKKICFVLKKYESCFTA